MTPAGHRRMQLSTWVVARTCLHDRLINEVRATGSDVNATTSAVAANRLTCLIRDRVCPDDVLAFLIAPVQIYFTSFYLDLLVSSILVIFQTAFRSHVYTTAPA